MVPQPLCNSHRRVYRRTGLGNSRHSQIVVSIKDTGTGIDPEIMPRLFSKFVTKSQSGTGLGLFISSSWWHDVGLKITILIKKMEEEHYSRLIYH
jgi:signal transduction histidine kinase